MSGVLNLSWLFIRNSLGLSILDYNRKHNTSAFAKQIGVLVGVPILLIPAYAVFLLFSGSLYGILASLGQTSGYLGIFDVMVSLLILFFGFAAILSTFYFDKTLEQIMPLPLYSWQIIIAKLLCVMVWEYLITILLMVPPMVFFGLGETVGLLYPIKCLVVVVTLPIFPVTLEAMVMMFFLGSKTLGSKKDTISVILMVIFLGLFLSIQLYIGNLGSQNTDMSAMATQLLNDNTFLLNRVVQSWPPAWLVSQAVLNPSIYGFLMTMILLASCALLVWLTVIIGERFYIRGLQRGDNAVKSNKKGVNAGVIHASKGSVYRVMAMDISLLLRTPIYFFNNVLINLIVPFFFILVIPLMKNSDDFHLFLETVNWLQGQPLITAGILLGFFILFGILSSCTPTTFSREGKGSWLTQCIPIPPESQIIGRCLTAILIQCLGIMAFLFCSTFIISLSPLMMITVTLCTLIAVLPAHLFGFLVDMYHPLLTWDNPQRAVKNNLNILITLLAGLFYSLLIGGIGVGLGFLLGYLWGIAIGIILSLLLSLFLFIIAKNRLPMCLRNFRQ